MHTADVATSQGQPIILEAYGVVVVPDKAGSWTTLSGFTPRAEPRLVSDFQGPHRSE